MRRLTVVLALNLALVAAGIGAHSLGVLAEGGDCLLDAAAAASGVAAAGAVIWVVRGWYWLDPAVALIIAVLVAYQDVQLIRTITRRRIPR